MAEKHYVFIDESGSAGDNLLDAQPIFTIVGVTAREANIASMNDRLRELKVAHHFAPDQELKGSRIVQNKHNVLMAEASEMVLWDGLPIFVEAVERKFMIAAKIVDEWTWPIEISRNRINRLSGFCRVY